MLLTIGLALLAALGGIAALLSWWNNRQLVRAQGRLTRDQSEETRFDLAQRYRERLETLERWKMEIADPELERCKRTDKAFKDLQKKYSSLEVKYQSLRAAIQIIQEKTIERDEAEEEEVASRERA